MAGEFPARLPVEYTGHPSRWSAAMSRPFLTAEWRHLVMLNYVVDPAVLQNYLPRGVELDDWQGQHYVSVVGFLFRDTRLLGCPIPGHRHFEEVNLRFYVRRYEGDELRRGVVFIREVAPRWAVCAVARRVYNEQYVCRRMTHELLPPAVGPGKISYRWQATTDWLEVAAEYAGSPQAFEHGSEAEYITEHYWAYTRQRDGSTSEYRVDHPPWRIWPTKSHKLTGDAVGFYGDEFARVFAAPPVSAFVAEGSPVAVYRGRRLPD